MSNMNSIAAAVDADFESEPTVASAPARQKETYIPQKFGSRTYLKMFGLSLIGVAAFLIPFESDGLWTIGVSWLSEFIMAVGKPVLMPAIMVILPASACITLYAKLLKNQKLLNIENETIRNLFYDVSPFWVVMRLLGGVFAIMVYFELGPVWIRGEETGLVAFEMIYYLGVTLTMSSWLIGFLINFGFMEFCGTLATKIMRPIFLLPGRAALDCLASWLGASPTAVIITTTQYNEGYYSDREGSIVTTCFSLVGVTAALVHIQVLRMGHMFLHVYATICVAGIACAVICARIPPLSRKKDTYIKGEYTGPSEDIPKNISTIRYAAQSGLHRARVTNHKPFIKEAVNTTIDIWIALFPIVMSLATLALILAEYTPVFDILSYPLVPILELLGIPEAATAAPSFLIGFPDQLMAAVIGAKVQSEYTRFILAVVTLNQLIYMSETGALILKSRLSVTFWQLVALFFQRTIITMPFAMAGAWLFVGK